VDYNVDKLADANVTSAAVVVLDAKTGEILAMVGSRDYFDEQHDGAVNVAVSARQPGSALKPFVYALAMQRGDTPATTVADIETQFFTQEGNPYVPRNYDYGYHGLVRYREALANSYNIAAVKTLEKVGVAQLMGFLKSAGVSTLSLTPEHYGLALALGDAEVRLLELTQAYGMFARGGTTLRPVALLGETSGKGERVLDEKIAWQVSDILSDNDARVAEFGDQSPLLLPFPSAAKTGTTRNSRDNWTVGYTPDRVVGVWVGNADNTPMRGTSGITGAGPIYHDVMLAAMQGVAPSAFRRPAGLTDVTVCRLSGLLPTPQCPGVLTEHFIAGTEPKKRDDLFRTFRIDSRNGLLATDACPPQFVQQKDFAVFPVELRKWARENGWQQPPVANSPLCGGAGTAVPAEPASLEITKPSASDSFKLDPLVPDRNEHVLFEAAADSGVRTVDWYVDGTKVGTGKAPDFRFSWSPKPGEFTIEAVSGDLRRQVRIEVLR
ncbi:MAG TPA: penicillin-binding transpeptidase domain-containing protein, partial [Candidatus Peribacteria bacterium]|nr:penicillin-binding transpeptidase domain-containing protein [Candidatus Peribacteria bacterium]